jgi:hypothetical protein
MRKKSTWFFSLIENKVCMTCDIFVVAKVAKLYIFSIYNKNTCVVEINIFMSCKYMTLFCTSIKGSVGLQPILFITHFGQLSL